MNERVVRHAIRGLVVLTVWAAIAGVIGAHVVLDHGSGTYTALLAFLPLLVAPGVLAWRTPTAKVLALWGAFGWICTIAWSIAGTPYRYERALEHWSYVAMPVWIAIALVAFVAPAGAMLMVKRREVAAEHELRAQRLRRIAVVVVALAAIVSATILMVGGAHGVVVAAFTLLLVAPAAFVIAYGSRAAALAWSAWCVPFAVIGVLVWLEIETVAHAGARIIVGGTGAIFVLLLIGIPLACLTPDGPFTGSAARASYRSRRR